MSSSSTEAEAEADGDLGRRAASLFDLLDSEGSGYICVEDLARCCGELAPEQLQQIFQQLDADGDGRVGLKDFQEGFRCIGMTLAANQRRGSSSSGGGGDANCRLSVKAHSQDDLDLDLDAEGDCFADAEETRKQLEAAQHLSCSEQVTQLHRLLSKQCPHLLDSFETIITDVANDVTAQRRERQRLEESWQKAKVENERHVQRLEEEMEAQLAKMEQRVRSSERRRLQDEYQDLQRTKQHEIDELQSMIASLQSRQAPTVPPETDAALKGKMDEAEEKNRRLLADMRQLETALAVSRSELARLRQDTDGKQREMEMERRSLHEHLREQQRLTEQLQLLHEANRRLHDTNDDLREALERQRDLRSPSSGRGSFCRTVSSATDCLSIFDPSLSHYEVVLPANDIFEEEGGGVGADADSGNSTFRDCGVDVGSDAEAAAFPDQFVLLPGSDTTLATVARRPNSLSLGTPGYNSSDASCGSSSEAASSSESRVARSRRRRRRRSFWQSASNRSGVESPPTTPPLGPPERMFKVVLAGDAAVGKSSFIMRFCEARFAGNLMSTLGVDFKTRTVGVDGQVVAIQLWDTAGQERFRSIAKSYFRRADGVVLVYDCTFERSFLSVRDWVTSIQECTETGVPIMLVANKTDLRHEVRQSGVKVVETEEGRRLADEFEAALFVETSAKSGSNVAASVRQLCRVLQRREDQAVGQAAIDLKAAPDNKKLPCCP